MLLLLKDQVLGTSVVLVLFIILESLVTCSNGKELFETSCSSSGIEVIINEECRSTNFLGIDFQNSFLWGDMTITDAATINPSGCQVTTDVNTVDSDNVQAWKWSVPFGTCGTTPTVETDKIQYDIYWNSYSDGDSDDKLLQMGQVKLTCNIALDPFQKDASPITLLEGKGIPIRNILFVNI